MNAMKAGRKKEIDKKVPRTPNIAVSPRNLSKKELGGVIFGCTRYTIKECISNLIFGLPDMHFSYVKNIEPGLPLFLFNYSDRELHGIYEAAGHGKMNINPYGWTANGSDNTHYPAQVRVRILKQCQVLSEDTYKKILDKNYSEDQVRFQFELDKAQTSQLLSLFEPLPVTRSPAMFSSSSPMLRPHYRPATNLCTRKNDQSMEAGTRPSKLKWISVIKQNSDSDSIKEGDDEPLVLQPILDEEVNTSRSDPEDITTCVEDETNPLELSPCCKKETWPSGVEDEVEDIYSKLKQLALDKGNFNPRKHMEDVYIPFEAENANLCDDGLLVLQPNLNEEINAYRSGPEGITTCLEDKTSPSELGPCCEKETWPSGHAPCLEEENKISETQTEAIEDEVEDVYSKLKQLTLDKENSTPKKHVEDISIPCEADNAQCSHVAPSATEKENSKSVEDTECAFPCGEDDFNLEDAGSLATQLSSDKKNSSPEEDIKDVFVPCGSNNSNLEDECSPTRPLTSEKSFKAADFESVINQLTKELKEMQDFQIDQQQKSKVLENELGESEVLLKYLRHRVKVLEARLQNPTTASDSYCGEPRLGVGDAVFIMGGYNGVSWLSTVDNYSPSRGIVNPVKSMNSVRSYASATVLNGLIYNIGGYNDQCKIWYDTAECYNPLTNEWISCPSLSERRGCVASASLNDKIYAVGGGNGADCFKDVEMFDPALGRWIPTQSMLQKRFASAAATLNGVLYVVGGYDGKSHLRSGERYDPREASWSKLQHMNTSRASHALSVLNGKLYALGGYDGSKYVSSMEVFDTRMGSWVEDDEMRRSRGYFAAPVIGERIYAIGGQAETNNIVDLVETYRVGHGWSVSKSEGIGKRCFFSAAVY